MIRIEPCTLAHIRQIIPRLRDGDRAELCAAGTPRHMLFRLWRDSMVKWTYFVDDDIAAVWGCAGAIAGDCGELWLFTTPAVERVPLSFLKEAKRSIAGILKTKRVVTSGVLAGYEKAERFLEGIGFKLEEPLPFGPHGALFRQVTLSR